MASARQHIEADTDMDHEKGEVVGDNDSEVAADVSEDDTKQNFVDELVQAGYGRDLAIRALEFVEAEDVSSGEELKFISLCRRMNNNHYK